MARASGGFLRWRWKQRYNSGAGLDAPLGWHSARAQSRIGNQPVQVTWYEADAFARCQEQLHRGRNLELPGEVPSGHVIRLPDETAYAQRVGPHYLGRVTAVGYRVVRGGHYHSAASFARAASRTWGDPDPDDEYDPARGFRLVIGPPH